MKKQEILIIFLIFSDLKVITMISWNGRKIKEISSTFQRIFKVWWRNRPVFMSGMIELVLITIPFMLINWSISAAPSVHYNDLKLGPIMAEFSVKFRSQSLKSITNANFGKFSRKILAGKWLNIQKFFRKRVDVQRLPSGFNSLIGVVLFKLKGLTCTMGCTLWRHHTTTI